ncbi:hypothetical protein [Pseudoalteromonas sp. OF7H-1]|uniref:hypothetical protein n=1 Tax=Pseudoalteromonas sp. OF7H-1 TaxID=2917755 RepID=UPI001EF68A73|nr:hypothetical protein [Pseudoalteromonas sp. OF7H-1]MCG7540950.1 hypothetical protein [Pseudoalteromonas sp. OF7H-1]
MEYEDIATRFFDFFKALNLTANNGKYEFYAKMFIVDDLYSQVNPLDIQAVVRTNPLLQYVESLGQEINDCDDYALQFKGALTALYRQRMHAQRQVINPPAVGMVFTENHALNIVIGTDDQVYLFDTMTAAPSLIGLENKEACLALLRQTNVRHIYI